MDNTHYVYAGFWIRVCAAMIDMIIWAILLSIIIQVMIASGLLPSDVAPTLVDYSEISLVDALEFIGLAVVTVYFWRKWQGTPGKIVLGLAVVDARTGKSLSIWQAIWRCVAYIPSYLIFFLGVIWVGIDEKKQGWHDKLAGTIVIKR